MRLIAGKYGRRVLVKDGKADCRPTTEKVRGAIFSTLSSRQGLEGIAILDLYAGTGALGFEALSRGADKVIFVERNKHQVRLIGENAKLLQVESQVRCEEMDALSFLKEAATGKKVVLLGKEIVRGFEVVFADPPYDEHPGDVLISELLQSKLLLESATVVIEGPPELVLHSQVSVGSRALTCFKQRIYGDTALWYYNEGGIIRKGGN